MLPRIPGCKSGTPGPQRLVLSGVLLSLAAVLLEDFAFRRYGRLPELLRLVAFSVAENFGYRQIITGYRIPGVFAYLRGDKAWGEIRRIGFAQPADGASYPGADA